MTCKSCGEPLQAITALRHVHPICPPVLRARHERQRRQEVDAARLARRRQALGRLRRERKRLAERRAQTQKARERREEILIERRFAEAKAAIREARIRAQRLAA
jgi:hypothetical protein